MNKQWKISLAVVALAIGLVQSAYAVQKVAAETTKPVTATAAAMPARRSPASSATHRKKSRRTPSRPRAYGIPFRCHTGAMAGCPATAP